MLFDFQHEQHVTFWMKNTYIPLDMIFIRADGPILRIAENTEPLSEAARPIGRAGARRARSDRRHRQEARHRGRRPGGALDLQRLIGGSRLVGSRENSNRPPAAPARGLLVKTEACIERPGVGLGV